MISNWAFAAPFPYEVSSSDITGSLDEFPDIVELLNTLSECQKDIIRLSRAWDLVPESCFLDPTDRETSAEYPQGVGHSLQSR